MQVVFEIIGMGAKKYGGFERYILEEARQLKERGYKLVVVFDTQPLADRYIEDLLHVGASYYVIPYQNKLRFTSAIFKLMRKYRPEVVHSNFSSNIFLVQIMACLMHVPVRISTEHCLPVLSTCKRRFLYTFLSILTNYILSVSAQSAQAVQKGLWLNKSKVKTLYLGVNDFAYEKSEMKKKYGLPMDKLLIMNVAYHHPVKGVDVLLRAFALLLKYPEVKDVVLCQIGGGQTGHDTSALKSLARSLGIEDRVIWMGLQNNVPEILSCGDIYCQPSRSEGIGLAIMEASLARLPVVATRVGGIPEVAVDKVNAYLVESEDADGLAGSMYMLYKDKAQRERMGYYGRLQALDKFCLSNQVTKLIECFYKI